MSNGGSAPPLTLRQFLLCMAAGSVPASVLYVVAGLLFIVEVGRETAAGPVLFIFFLVAWLVAGQVFGLASWFISFRQHQSWLRLAFVPGLTAAFLLWPGVVGDMAFTRTLPMPLALMTFFGAAASAGVLWRSRQPRK